MLVAVEDRKDWLRGFKSGTHADYNVESVTYESFINKELILFSVSAANGGFVLVLPRLLLIVAASSKVFLLWGWGVFWLLCDRAIKRMPYSLAEFVCVASAAKGATQDAAISNVLPHVWEYSTRIPGILFGRSWWEGFNYSRAPFRGKLLTGLTSMTVTRDLYTWQVCLVDGWS